MEERENVMLEETEMEVAEERTEKKSGLGPVAGMAIGAGLTLLTMWAVNKFKKVRAKRREENQNSDGTIEGTYEEKSES